MRARSALLASLLVVGTAAGAAQAAPKPKLPCQLVVDPAGDTFLLRYQDSYHARGVPYGPQEDAMDLVSADVASNAKTITAVLRLKNVAAPVSSSPGGVSYDVNFTIPDSTKGLYLRAVVASGAKPTFEGGVKDPVGAGGINLTTVSTKLADGTGVIDPKTNEIRIHVPVAAFSQQGTGITAGKKLTLGEITSGRYAAGRGVFADVVVADKVYAAGAKNCVTPGK